MELCCHLYPFSKRIPICMYLPYMHYYMYIYQFNLFTNVEQLSSPPNYRGYFIFLSKCKLIFITCLLLTIFVSEFIIVVSLLAMLATWACVCSMVMFVKSFTCYRSFKCSALNYCMFIHLQYIKRIILFNLRYCIYMYH